MPPWDSGNAPRNTPPGVPQPGAVYCPGPRPGPGLSRGVRILLVVAEIVVVLLILAVVGVTGYFRHTSETAALRKAAVASLPGTCTKKIALNIGWFTTACIRNGSHFIDMPDEARAAMDSLRGVDFGVYELSREPSEEALARLINRADAAMKSRGWDRIVAVRESGTMIAVYFPRKASSFSNTRVCTLVVDDCDMVVASASANLDSLVALAHESMGPDFFGSASRKLPAQTSLAAARR